MRCTSLAAGLLMASLGSASRTSGAILQGLDSTVGTCVNPSIRYEWRDMTEAHRAAYLQAEKCLMGKPSQSGLPGATNRFEDMQAVHKNMTLSIHNVGQFLPWHRYFLHVHETLLRTECGYTSPMLWWDETKDAGNFAAAPVFTSQYFGTAKPETAANPSTCVTDGVFANQMLHINPDGNAPNVCLARGLQETASKGITPYYVEYCNSKANYTAMWECTFTGVHALGHDSIGGIMADVDFSPADPIFFMHHSFVDRNWRIWQNADPNNRLFQVNGYDTQTEPSTGWVQTGLNYVLSTMNILPDTTIYNVMNTEGGYLCYKYNY